MTTTTTLGATQGTEPPADDALPTRIGRLANVIGSERCSAADRAALKRWGPGQPPPFAFYRLWLRDLGTDLPPSAQTRTWMLIAWGLALGVAHRRDRPLGQALSEAGLAEARLERLLGSDPEILPDLLASAIRFLASKTETIDWLDAARLLLSQDADKRETIHRRIARAYFRHQPRNDQE